MKIINSYALKVASLLLMTTLAGCFMRPYKFDLFQGNVVTLEQVAQIQTGMSQEQVRYALGTPLLQDIFHPERWEYVYLEKYGYGKEHQRHLTIYFSDGRVERVTHEPLKPAENAS